MIFHYSSHDLQWKKQKWKFQNDTINAFWENIPLITTTSGHYAIPVTSAKQAISNIDRENNSAITLTINNINGKSNQTIALKLHQQFAHPSSEKLISLLNNAGTPWCGNTDLKKRNQKRYRKLLNMSCIPQSTTQANSRITNG